MCRENEILVPEKQKVFFKEKNNDSRRRRKVN